eukprot:365252-Chlamydomonas_euryale.AAC.58
MRGKGGSTVERAAGRNNHRGTNIFTRQASARRHLPAPRANDGSACVCLAHPIPLLTSPGTHDAWRRPQSSCNMLHGA